MQRATVSSMGATRPTGFTLVEFLVVAALFAVLLAILLPAIQGSRSAARKMHCQNNLKQLALAILQYNDTYARLPPWAIQAGEWDYEGALTLALPFLAEAPKLELVKQGTRRVPVFECPSDGALDSLPAPLSYCVNASPGVGSGSVLSGPFNFMLNTGIRLQEVSDGASNTAALSERVSRLADGSAANATTTPQRYTWSVIIPPVSAATLADPLAPASLAERAAQTDLSIAACISGPRTFLPVSVPLGASWLKPNCVDTSYTHWIPPNSSKCEANNIPPDGPFLPDAFAATSDHVGGVNVAFLDGSVRLTAQVIDIRVWRAAGTINGSEEFSIKE